MKLKELMEFFRTFQTKIKIDDRVEINSDSPYRSHEKRSKGRRLEGLAESIALLAKNFRQTMKKPNK